MRIAALLASFAGVAVGLPVAAQPVVTSSVQAARPVVDASAPAQRAVTVYRDPQRGEGGEMNRNWPQGFAMISETRTVTLPPGESTIRFEGVAEGMLAVSAIVTGLPGGTIEKNRNAELLSPAALVNGMLGNRVTITRTNPATGVATPESAVVRTRADGGLVLQTASGFESVRCSGLPEKLTFDRVPRGLSAQPVFSIDTHDASGGTYQVVLTYLAWGFDWEANYVATLGQGDGQGGFAMRLMSWLTVLNDNGQSFPDAELMAVAGTLNVTSDFQELAEEPVAEPLRLVCYPFGSTAAGTPVHELFPPPPPPPPPAPALYGPAAAEAIVVTGARLDRRRLDFASPVAVIAAEEQLGDLKLYRVPEPVTVNAKGLKQVAFLVKDAVKGRFVYRASCEPHDMFDQIDDVFDMERTQMLLVTKNTTQMGLGAALPMGGLTLYEPASTGPQLVARLDMRDYAQGQDVELELGESAQVFSECASVDGKDVDDKGKRWTRMRAQLTNANSTPATVRLNFGWPQDWQVRWPKAKPIVKDGSLILELEIPANATRSFDWKIRKANAD